MTPFAATPQTTSAGVLAAQSAGDLPIGRHVDRRDPVLPLGGVAVFIVAAAFAVLRRPTPPTTGWPDRTVGTVALGVVLSVVMSAAILLCARAARSSVFLALCGRRPLYIFLAHIVLASGSRIVLVKLGVHSVAPLIAVGLVLGVVGSLAVAGVARRAGLSWVFDGPTPSAPGRGHAADRKAFNPRKWVSGWAWATSLAKPKAR